MMGMAAPLGGPSEEASLRFQEDPDLEAAETIIFPAFANFFRKIPKTPEEFFDLMAGMPPVFTGMFTRFANVF